MKRFHIKVNCNHHSHYSRPFLFLALLPFPMAEKKTFSSQTETDWQARRRVARLQYKARG